MGITKQGAFDACYDVVHGQKELGRLLAFVDGLPDETLAILRGGSSNEAIVEFLRVKAEAGVVGQGPSSQADFVKAFTLKLPVDRPDQAAITRLITHYSHAMMLAASPGADAEAAIQLYEAAKAMPGSSTRMKMVENLMISLNGPWLESHPNIISGVNLATGKPLVVKLLLTHEHMLKQAAGAQERAVTDLNLEDPPVPLVPTKVLQISVEAEDAAVLRMGPGPRKVLAMPWYVGSLSSLPQLSSELIVAGAERITKALKYMHGKGLVHMDIKPANIMMDADGQWWLGDMGSMTPTGEEVWSFTPNMYPGEQPRIADPTIDWGLLLVTVAILIDKDNLEGLMDANGALGLDKIKQRCNKDGQLASLTVLVEGLLILAGLK